jgi:hypothetical protein
VVSFQLLSFDPPVPSFFISIIILRDYFHFSPTPKKVNLLETQGPLHWPMLCMKTKASPILTFVVSIFYSFLSCAFHQHQKSQQYWRHRGQCIGQCFA